MIGARRETGGSPVGAVEQQDQLTVVARRFAEIAPERWVHLVGSWEATLDEAGDVRLNWITTAVVDGRDRWLYGQVGYDEPLYDAVVRLNELSAEPGPEHRWTTCELRLDRDGSIQVDFGHEPPKRSRGIHDEESLGRYERYLDAWVAVHGPRPGGTAPSADG